MNSGRSIASRSTDISKPRLVPLAQAFDDIGVSARDILELERICGNVVELQARVGRRRALPCPQGLNEFEALRLHGKRAVEFGLVSPVPLDIQRAVRPGLSFREQQGLQACAVKGNAWRPANPAQLEKRRGHVDVGRDAIYLQSLLESSRPAHEKGHANSAL